MVTDSSKQQKRPRTHSASGHLVSRAATLVGEGEVVSGRDLHTTQTAPEQDIIWRQTPHYPLSEAEFNLMVDPPPRTHQWLPTARGAWLTTLIVIFVAIYSALQKQQPLAWSTVPTSAWVGFSVTTILILGIHAAIWCKPDRRKQMIERIRKTWNRI